MFDSTPWTEVLAAGDSNNMSRRSALETLCAAYWRPLHLYIRRKIRDPHLAQDLTQSFFERLLSGKLLKLVDPARGRFRTFLMQSLDWHLANEYRESRALKRGGQIQLMPLDLSQQDSVVADDGNLTPDQIFEREWALTLLNLTMQRLMAEQAELNKAHQFDVLKGFLTGDGPSGGYSAACEQLQISEPALRMAVSRLRSRYRELLREEILRTVASGEDVEDEIRHLFLALTFR